MVRVNNIYPTIQGEGVHTGVPMVIVRLQGCRVGCPWCDTKETWDVDDQDRAASLGFGEKADPRRWVEMAESAVADYARRIGPKIGWALVTGGEPAEQNLTALVSALQARGFDAALETSGTALGHVDALFDWVCVSPKLDMPGGLPILVEALRPANEVKMVVGKEADVERFERWLGSIRLESWSPVVSLQPVSANKRATEICVEACLARGWRLSVQAHKTINIA